MLPGGLAINRRGVMLAALALAWPVGAVAQSGRAVSASSLVRAGDPVFGNPKGDVTIVDFYDIRCPPCRRMDGSINELLRHDAGVRYVPVDYPILGPPSELGTRALFAAQMQGKYTVMRERLLREAAVPTMDVLQADAKALGLDWQKMEFDMDGDEVEARISTNLARGQKLDLQGIPAMYVNEIFVPGELSYNDLVSIVAMARKKLSDDARKPA